MTIDLSLANFEQEVLAYAKPVLIDFWAKWCGPCQMLSLIVEELAQEMAETKICKIDVEAQPELTQYFEILRIPTLAVVQDGKILHMSVGLRPKEEIRDIMGLN